MSRLSLTSDLSMDHQLSKGSPDGSTLLTVLSLCFDVAQHPEFVEGSKEGEHSS
jgi:hypothetical protein